MSFRRYLAPFDVARLRKLGKDQCNVVMEVPSLPNPSDSHYSRALSPIPGRLTGMLELFFDSLSSGQLFMLPFCQVFSFEAHECKRVRIKIIYACV